MAKLNTGSFAITIALLSGMLGPVSAMAQTYGNSGNNMASAMLLMGAGGMGGAGASYNCTNSGNATQDKMKTQCDNSKSDITYATVSNIMGQQLGSAAQQTAGQIQLQNAMTAPQQNALAVQAQANASLAQTGAMTQLGLGAINAAWGAYLLKRSGLHSGNASSLNDAKTSGALKGITAIKEGSTESRGRNPNENGYVTAPSGYAANILQENNFNSNYKGITTTFSPNDPQAAEKMKKRNSEISTKEDVARSLVSNTLAKGANEQDGMASNLKVSGILTAVMGASQVAAGGMSMMAAAQAENAAKQLSALSTSPLPNFAPAQANVLPPTAVAANSPGALAPGSSAGPAVAPTGGGLVPTSGAGTLGAPFGTNAPALAQGPVPQGYGQNPNQMQQPMDMGGAPMMGDTGGGTPPAKPDTQNNLPTPANNRMPSLYSGGGGTYGGGLAPGVGADKGPDLSGLLAQFLPKKEEETSKKGIMDFGSRSPASAEPYSYLGREVNLFERVSEAIMDNTRRGTVGI